MMHYLIKILCHSSQRYNDLLQCVHKDIRGCSLIKPFCKVQLVACEEDAGNLSNKLVHYLWHFQSFLCASEVIPIDSVANKGSKHPIDH